ncbi:MAG TPA: hypothetical protein VK824_05855 [Planctomycetota bacterium]|nr:hypothetical protein [Planctomycetota bacterium]
MKRLLSVALLCAVAAGCAAAPVAKPVAGPETAKGYGIQAWIPATFADLYETVDARIGLDYGFGAHLKVTDLARIGILDYSEFSLIGVDKDIFYGEYHFPDLAAWKKNGSWDLSAKVGVGLGAEATLHTWEVVDFASTLLTLNYWSFNND